MGEEGEEVKLPVIVLALTVIACVQVHAGWVGPEVVVEIPKAVDGECPEGMEYCYFSGLFEEFYLFPDGRLAVPDQGQKCTLIYNPDSNNITLSEWDCFESDETPSQISSNKIYTQQFDIKIGPRDSQKGSKVEIGIFWVALGKYYFDGDQRGMGLDRIYLSRNTRDGILYFYMGLDGEYILEEGDPLDIIERGVRRFYNEKKAKFKVQCESGDYKVYLKKYDVEDVFRDKHNNLYAWDLNRIVRYDCSGHITEYVYDGWETTSMYSFYLYVDLDGNFYMSVEDEDYISIHKWTWVDEE